jgi:hypothetical protein
MTYEVLISKGADIEKGLKSDDGHVFTIKYLEERPAMYADYESVFKGDPYEHMAYKIRNQANWSSLPLPPPEPVEKKSLITSIMEWFRNG